MARAAEQPAPAGGPAGHWANRLQQAWSGRNALARLLWPLSQLMRCLVGTRRLMYRLGLLRSQRLPVPVVVVGNLIVGGAGKTPVVMAMAALLQAQGHCPGIVSRGYAGAASAPLLVTAATPAALAGDEPLLLHLRTGMPVCVGRDRVAAARALLDRHPQTAIIISDDGLQHLAL
ncbi:MAG: tetraacyldisaccharide 4'-kinase, partial [Ideonella sp.]